MKIWMGIVESFVHYKIQQQFVGAVNFNVEAV
jgi:hypothetical protein